MNTRIEQHELDRLVDGELSAEEYRALLARFETSPEGWRSCGLAFLESQALGQEFGRVVCEGEAARQAAPAQPARRLSSRALEFAGWSAALAASLFLAFWLGGALGPGDPPARVADPPVLARETPAAPRDVTLVVGGEPGSGNLSSFRVPLVETTPEEADWLSGEVTGMPEEVQRYLESQGHRVHRTFRLMTVDVGGGRQAIVPMEQFEIVPAESRDYQ